MAALRFQLFRIKLQLPSQMPLFGPRKLPSNILSAAIREKPSGELHKSHTWHIGNVSRVDSLGLYFALGRTTKTTVEHYDKDTGNFTVAEFEVAPYTHALLDTELELCAIAAKSKLAPSPKGIGNKLRDLLNTTTFARELGITFQISEIDDPRDFFTRLRKAYAVSYFSMTFTPPNPIDVDKLYRRPLELLLRDASADKGHATIKGEDMDSGVLEALARATVASGDEVKAKIQTVAASKPKMRYSRGNPVIIDAEGADSKHQRLDLLKRLREIYRRIRGETQ